MPRTLKQKMEKITFEPVLKITLLIRSAVLTVILGAVLGCGLPQVKFTHTDNSTYVLLWEKSISGGCVAAFSSGTYLYLVSKNRWKGGTTKVAVYERGKNFFAVASTKNPIGTCGSIELNNVELLPHVQKSYFADSEFRGLFDNALERPGALKEAINSGAPYYRADNKWNDRQTTNSFIQLDQPEAKIKNVSDVSNYVTSIDKEMLAKYISKREKQIMESDAKRKERIRKRKAAQEIWDNRLSQAIKVGDKVCTYEKNYFGYIEEYSDDKVKIYMVGKAQWRHGYFFSGLDSKFSYHPVEAIRWLTRNEIAPCHFSI